MKRLNWNNAIYYGEVFGFLFAWAIGMVIAMNGAQEDPAKPDAKNIASATMGGILLD
jgi:hypothetical protein